MLQKRIDLGSIPYGLAVAGEDLTKGDAVIVKVVSGELVALRPTTEAEAKAVMGFVTFRIEEEGKADTEFDTIKEGKRCVIYTLVKNNQWATTQFAGDSLALGDELVVGYDATTAMDAGKLRAKSSAEVTASRPSQFRVYARNGAGVGYTTAMVEVDVL